MMRWLTGLVLSLGVGILIGCGDSDSDAEVVPATQESFTNAGSYGVGVRDFVFIDTSRSTPPNRDYLGASERTLPTRVWYPTDGASGQGAGAVTAVADDGPFPFIGYAHGYLSALGEAEDLKRHLASHGYIVAAPTFPLSNGNAPGGPTVGDLASQPADLAYVMNAVAALDGGDADLAAAVDRDRQGIAGLSAGGATVLIAAYHPVLHLTEIKAAAAFAPLACPFAADFYARPFPLLIVSASADRLIPFSSSAALALEHAPPPLTVANLLGGTHIGFAGFEIVGSENSDEVACFLVAGSDPTSGSEALAEALTAGTIGTVVDPAGCGDGGVCEERYIQTMRAARQIELQKIATLAHFEAELRGRADAAAFRDRVLGESNDDVEVSLKH